VTGGGSTASGLSVRAARTLWDPVPGWLNTASYGLPPRPAWEALQAALADWRVGATSWEGWDTSTGESRARFARLVGVEPGDVAVGSGVAQMLAPVGAALPDNAVVLAPEQEFTSATFPFAAHARRGVRVRTAPLRRLAEHVDDAVDLVVFSLVQSADGEVARYDEIIGAARAHDALVVVDATQACGWLPFDARPADAVVVGAYKWLMGPRGTAFAYLGPRLRELVTPLSASWYAAHDVHASYYGLPMRLADSARRFDTSPAWFSWVGTAPALAVVEEIGVAAIHHHNVALANRFLTGLGRAPSGSAIVTVDVPDAQERLAAAGVRAAVRAGRVRASFHVYSTEADVDLALNALT
jgi:selenocysteine lyase/cysteine desulfurase